MNRLSRQVYNSLPVEEKQEILRKIGQKYGMELKGFGEFSKWGQSTYTGIYQAEGREFVFVPGDQATLGWESFTQGMDKETREDIQEDLNGFEIEEPLEEFLNSVTSPVRQVEISPMLVERNLKEIGWVQVELDDPRLQREEYKQARESLESMGCSAYEINESVKFCRTSQGTAAYLYFSQSYEEFVNSIGEEGYRLPTADEWEYLCGGGCRTLFPWGDSFDYSMHLHHFEEEQDKGKPYDMEEPNFFGLSIAFDPYKYEVLMDSVPFLRGGDGGCNICGGLGVAMGYLPCSPYFINMYEDDDSLDYRSDIGGNYTFYRRIIRVEE